jgi:alginate O-acetyltransferase complex protein AlgI
MIFSSLLFVFVFLPIMLTVYYLAPRVLKNLMLVVGSLIFYAWGEPIYVFLMLFVCIFDYFNGRLLAKFNDRKTWRRTVLAISLTVDLGVLGFFKYFGFLIANINALLDLNLVAKELPLPIGISFYIFQSISYIVDVYLGRVQA